MGILTETKKTLDDQFGAAAPAKVLIGGEELFEVDEAFGYTLGRFNMVVGFHGGIATYACFAKEKLDDPKFYEQDVEVCQALLAPESKWEDYKAPDAGEDGGAGSTWIVAEYETKIKGANGKEVRVIGSHRTTRPYFFAYIPIAAPDAGEGKLDELVEAMNEAHSQREKMEAVIAVVNELVAAQKGKRNPG